MIIKEITNYLETIAPISSQESYDNCGLIVGDETNECSGVLVSLDCIEKTVQEAIAKGVNLIIAHHPIVFKGLKKINGKNYIERTVVKAIKNDIAIYALHTNYDNYLNGVNAEIADRIGVSNPRVLEPKKDVLSKIVVFVPLDHKENVAEAMFKAGAGEIGNYSNVGFSIEGVGTFLPMEKATPFKGEKNELSIENEIRFEVLVSNHKLSNVISALLQTHPYEEVAYEVYDIRNNNQNEGSGMIGMLDTPMETMAFLQMIKERFNCGVIKHTEIIKKEISKVAFCGGAGSFLMKSAMHQGADIFITGDYKYHEFFDAENKIIIADIGHFESEQYTSDRLACVLMKKFRNFAVHLTEVNTNPINYF